MSRKSIAIFLTSVLAVIVIAVLMMMNRDYAFNGVIYQDPKPAPDFNLSSISGEYQLSDHRGELILIFFGYTSCPDVCPATLADMKNLVAEIPGWAEQLEVVFITVDPERDTADRLAQYVSLFNDRFIGLTGTEEELNPVWASYGVVREIDNETGSMAGYLVNHTARIYLVDQEGRLLLTYGFGTPPDEIREDVEYLLGD